MNTCKTCKWWEGFYLPDIKDSTIEQFRYCRSKRFAYSWGPIDSDNEVGLSDCLYGEIEHDDLNSSAGEVLTGPDFGCIHHEPKEEL